MSRSRLSMRDFLQVIMNECTVYIYITKIITNNTIPAPSVVIYDNACNLHSYCLNREPAFFKQSWMVVDRFHWPNDTGRFNIMLADPEYNI